MTCWMAHLVKAPPCVAWINLTAPDLTQTMPVPTMASSSIGQCTICDYMVREGSVG
uniref:Uncharacterized protein n=1 Tax=Anguilla anguilla TaxID=7936 RepID=A0A0E9PVP9_ANGAN